MTTWWLIKQKMTLEGEGHAKGYNPAMAQEFEFIEWIKSRQKTGEFLRLSVGEGLRIAAPIAS